MKVLYVTNSVFPSGAAYSSRIIGFIQILNTLNHDVFVLADFSNNKTKQILKFNSHTEYKIITGKPSSISRIIATMKAKRELAKLMKEKKFDLVISGNTYDRFRFVLSICKKKEIPLILEICEEYDVKTFSYWRINPYTYIYKYCFNYTYRNANAYFVISEYLERKFLTTNKKVGLIYSIFDVINSEYSITTYNERCSIVQIGFPGKQKELFRQIFLSLLKLKKEGFQFHYSIYGTTELQISMNEGGCSELLLELDNFVSIKGIVDHQKVNQIYINADYSIFFRPQKKSNTAGFPTKLAESFIAGTPVITNLTGDIGLFVTEDTGVIIKDSHLDSVYTGIKTAITYNRNKRHELRRNCREVAEKNFDYRNKTLKVSEIIQASVKDVKKK